MSIFVAGIDRTVESLTAAYEYAQQVNSTSQTTVVEQTEKTTTDGSEVEVKVLNKYDRVEISSDAYQNYQNTSALSAVSDSAEQTEAKDAASEIQEALASVESEEELNLEKLSEAELKTLVAEGTITQAEANAELLRRAKEKEAAEAEAARKEQQPDKPKEPDSSQKISDDE